MSQTRYVAQVGTEIAGYADQIGYDEGMEPIFRNAGDGAVEIVDLQAARSLSPDRDGSITEATDDHPMQVWFGGNGYAVEQQS